MELVAWGLYYGVILIFEKYFFHRVLDKLPEVLRHIYSLVLVMVGWVLFSVRPLQERWSI